MNDSLKPGSSKEISVTVKSSDTASAHGSGLLDVYSTPAMVALMEKTSMELVQPGLDQGLGTVGTALDIRHMKAVNKGEIVRCLSVLKTMEGNKLTFEVKVYHGEDLVGEGIHKRYIIEESRFLSKLK